MPGCGATILGCEGKALSPDEAAFFRDADPWGFILFSRNVGDPGQLDALCADLRAAVGRDAPILIDQEGGRVARLKPPHWRLPPAARLFGALAARDLEAGLEAARINARLIAHDLHGLGVTINCAPVLDIPIAGAHDVIGDRAFAMDAAATAALGDAVCDGLLAGGILPVIKHIPGHGRATLDSHHGLPRTDAPLDVLQETDFAPFAALSRRPWAMTAHMVYGAVHEAPATCSKVLIDQVIRGHMGFDGVLFSDDLSMEALGGSLDSRARAALDAGCDLVEHCNGRLDEMETVAAAVGPLDAAARRRVDTAEALRRDPDPIEAPALEARLDNFLSDL